MSKADIELALHKTGMRKDRLLTSLEQQKRKVSNSMGVAELQQHKSEVVSQDFDKVQSRGSNIILVEL